MIILTNTLSKKKEVFVPIDLNNVKMYVCGPTVYDRPHLGNARSAVIYDILFRLLKSSFKQVTYVRNITDVDDKIINKANETNVDIKTLTESMINFYHSDLEALGCLSPTYEPKATEHVSNMIKLINKLIEKGFAYEEQGHVLFSIDKFPEYGQLSKRSLEELIQGARVEIAPYKHNSCDFVLWKPAKKNEEGASFNSPWGIGRPGWHIECSAMSQAYLGDTFDIHGGGADLTFPHHENEVAQSKCANDVENYANFWVHNGFLTVDGEKMSKSLGNFLTVHEVISNGVEGAVLRYLYMTTHYHKPLDYNKNALYNSRKAVEKFRTALDGYSDEGIDQHALKLLSDDINTPEVLAYMHELASDINKGNEDKKVNLARSASLIGLDLSAHITIPKNIQRLVQLRLEARKKKDWEMADKLRQEILTSGYVMEDISGGKYRIVKAG